VTSNPKPDHGLTVENGCGTVVLINPGGVNAMFWIDLLPGEAGLQGRRSPLGIGLAGILLSLLFQLSV
jgi:hypothetical protein